MHGTLWWAAQILLELWWAAQVLLELWWAAQVLLEEAVFLREKLTGSRKF